MLPSAKDFYRGGFAGAGLSFALRPVASAIGGLKQLSDLVAVGAIENKYAARYGWGITALGKTRHSRSSRNFGDDVTRRDSSLRSE